MTLRSTGLMYVKCIYLSFVPINIYSMSKGTLHFSKFSLTLKPFLAKERLFCPHSTFKYQNSFLIETITCAPKIYLVILLFEKNVSLPTITDVTLPNSEQCQWRLFSNNLVYADGRKISYGRTNLVFTL